jgi:hypothetical protein
MVCGLAMRKGVVPICTVHGATYGQTRRSEHAPSLVARISNYAIY